MSKILLHACCAICASHPYPFLKEMGHEVVLYFYNQNIYPKEEYNRRLNELIKFAEINNAKLIVESGDYESWKNLIKGYENEPEKGKRCEICFKERLQKTVQAAKENNCEYFTTTLTVSPHKNSKQIFAVANEIAKNNGFPFWEIDFKKNDGFLKTSKIADSYGFYRQKYCGCEFSIRD